MEIWRLATCGHGLQRSSINEIYNVHLYQPTNSLNAPRSHNITLMSVVEAYAEADTQFLIPHRVSTIVDDLRHRLQPQHNRTILTIARQPPPICFA